MERIAQLLFEARSLKRLPRSGYQFLGTGSESVAEHSFTATFIAYVISQLVPEVDDRRLITMCLVHDLAEARVGDLNYVQRFYVEPDEATAVADMTENLPFGRDLLSLIEEFNQGDSLEARLAHDADQLAFLIELKNLADLGLTPPADWIPNVRDRLQTAIGRTIAAALLSAPADTWWRQKFIDRSDHSQ